MMNRFALLIMLIAGSIGSVRAADRWDQVLQLQPNDTVRVARISAGSHTRTWLTGEFQSASPETLVLILDRNKLIEIKKEEVRRVELFRKKSRMRRSLPYIGLAAGFSIGYLAGRKPNPLPGSNIGWIIALNRNSHPPASPVVGLVGAAIGGGIGVLASHRRHEVIYRSPRDVK